MLLMLFLTLESSLETCFAPQVLFYSHQSLNHWFHSLLFSITLKDIHLEHRRANDVLSVKVALPE